MTSHCSLHAGVVFFTYVRVVFDLAGLTSGEVVFAYVGS